MIINTIAQQQSLSNFQKKYFDREPRVNLKFVLWLRRSENSRWFMKFAETINVSRSGACIVSQVPLPIGSELEVTACKDKFQGRARVCHSTRSDYHNGYLIGLELIEKNGKWVVG
jgi:hypothetical protein